MLHFRWLKVSSFFRLMPICIKPTPHEESAKALSAPLTRPLHPISIVNSIGPKSSSLACLFSVLLQYCGVLPPLDKLKVICQKKPCDNVLSSIGHLSTICLERQSVYRQTLGMAPFRAKGFTVHYGRNGTNCVQILWGLIYKIAATFSARGTSRIENYPVNISCHLMRHLRENIL